MAKPRVFVVGLDGATWKVIDPLIEKGKLPFFKEIVRKGASGTLESTLPPLTAPAWVSFQTGVNPGKHGIFGFLNIRQNPVDPLIVSSNDIKEIRIWDYLGRSGLKSLIINMPVSHPVSEIPGILISSFLTPPEATFVYPESLRKELKKIGYEIDLFFEHKNRKLGQKKFPDRRERETLDRLLNVVEKRVKAFKMLSKREDFSFFFLLFKETDIAQHLFWGQDRLAEFYIRLDRILEDLYNYFDKKFDGEKSFLLISDHGFHKISEVEFSLYAWLKSRSRARTKAVSIASFWRFASFLNAGFKALGFSLTRIGIVKKIRSLVVSKAEKKELKNTIENLGLLAAQEGLYFLKNFGGNKNKLVDDLRDITYQGEKVFKKVHLAKRVYRGKYVDKGPDIIWLTNEKFSINFSPVAKKVFNIRETNVKGDHLSDQEGIFVASGECINKKSRANFSILDIYPLVCYLLDVGIPGWLDGKLPKEIISDRLRKARTEKQEIEELVAKSIKQI